MKRSTKVRLRKTGLRSKPKLLIAGSALAVAIAVFAVLELGGTTNFFGNEQPAAPASTNLPTSDADIYKPATEQEKKEVEDRKLDSNQPKPSTAPVESKATILSATQQNDINSVVVTTKLTGSSWQACKLTLSKGNLVVTKTAEALYQPEYSSCLGFSVPIDELSQAGDWQVSLTATKSGGEVFSAESKTVTVTK